MKRFLLFRTLVAVIFVFISYKSASADVLYQFSGTLDSTITYNNIDPSTPIPFAPNQPVYAQIYVPEFFGGGFAVEEHLYVNGVDKGFATNDGFYGVIDFGLGFADINMNVGFTDFATAGSFPAAVRPHVR